MDIYDCKVSLLNVHQFAKKRVGVSVESFFQEAKDRLKHEKAFVPEIISRTTLNIGN